MWQFLRIIILLVLFVFFLRYTEKRVLFYPTKDVSYSPAEVGLDFEDIFFKAADNVNINGWFVPCLDAEYTILFCHGNAGNIANRVEKLKFFHDLKCNVFIFDYRGYGKSEGSPSEEGIYKDVKGAYDYLLSRRIRPATIIGYGESLGGAVITDLALKEKLAGLITDSSITSVKDMVKKIYPFLPYWLFASRLDAESKIKSIAAPKLIIHSINDEIVPYAQGLKLFKAAAKPKEFLKIHGGHNSGFYECEDILKDKIGNFIRGIKR